MKYDQLEFDFSPKHDFDFRKLGIFGGQGIDLDKLVIRSLPNPYPMTFYYDMEASSFVTRVENERT